MAGRLQDKVALITGAARGQGRAEAVRLAEDGADIIGLDVCADIPTVPYELATPADLAETAKLVEAAGRRMHTAQVDVRDYAALAAAVDTGVAEFGRLDIICANAGIAAPAVSTTELGLDAWSTMVDINLTGVWHTTRAAVPHIVAGGRGGAVVLTSSVAGLRAYANCGNYIATKHAVVGLMRALALELGEHGIRVNSVHPTQVDTPMIMNEPLFKVFLPDVEHPTREMFAPVSQSTHVLPTPWVDPSDIASAVAFLVSEEARFITGVTLPIDAGALLKS